MSSKCIILCYFFFLFLFFIHFIDATSIQSHEVATTLLRRIKDMCRWVNALTLDCAGDQNLPNFEITHCAHFFITLCVRQTKVCSRIRSWTGYSLITVRLFYHAFLASSPWPIHASRETCFQTLKCLLSRHGSTFATNWYEVRNSDIQLYRDSSPDPSGYPFRGSTAEFPPINSEDHNGTDMGCIHFSFFGVIHTFWPLCVSSALG